MKITVITDDTGNVLGTQRTSDEHSKESGHGPTASSKVAAGPKQRVTEIDVPDEALKGSAEDLHKAVARHLKK